MYTLMKEGDVVVSRGGVTLTITRLLAAGGQGLVALAKAVQTGACHVVKQLYTDFNTPENRKRFDYLCKLDLRGKCRLLVGPIDMIEFDGTFGYYSDYIDGVELQELIRKEKPTWMERLMLAISILGALCRLHAMGLWHGDIGLRNLLVVKSGDGDLLTPYWIDFDNARIPGLPPPPSSGDENYMPVEIYKPFLKGKFVSPDFYTESFAIGVLMEEILLGHGPQHGYGKMDNLRSWALHEGIWRHDPKGKFPPKDLPGYSPALLNERILRLFRQNYGLVPKARPTSFRWRDELIAATHESDLCEHCGSASLVDSLKEACHNCGKAYSIMKAVLPDSKEILIDAPYVPVGRHNLGGSASIPRSVGVLRRKGPFVVVESKGPGVSLKMGEHWINIRDGKSMTAVEGDIVRMAGREMRILRNT